MPATPPATVDLQGEYIQHVPLLASEDWEHLQLIYEREPAGEMPENQLDRHVLIICQGNCRANYWLDGRWQAAEYTNGDLVWMPSSELFPKVQLDRLVPLLEFTIEPNPIHQIAGAAHSQISPLLKFRDPLIYQMGMSSDCQCPKLSRSAKFIDRRNLSASRISEPKSFYAGISPAYWRHAQSLSRSTLNLLKIGLLFGRMEQTTRSVDL